MHEKKTPLTTPYSRAYGKGNLSTSSEVSAAALVAIYCGQNQRINLAEKIVQSPLQSGSQATEKLSELWPEGNVDCMHCAWVIFMKI